MIRGPGGIRNTAVHALIRQGDEEIAVATKKGEKFADAHYTIDARDRFVTEYLFPAIRANGSYEGYPMGTALARPLIAEEVVRVDPFENNIPYDWSLKHG